MAKAGKKYQEAAKLIEEGKFYGLPEAVEIVKKTATAKFDETKAWNLPVVDDKGCYMGFISRSGLFSSYRRTLVSFTAD